MDKTKVVQSQTDSIAKSQSVNGAAADICKTIMNETDKLIEARISKAAYDKTYFGIISELLFDASTTPDDKNYYRYKVYYNNTIQEFTLKDGVIHSVGDRVKITIPRGVMKDKIAEVLTPTPYPSNYEYDDTNDKLIVTYTNYEGSSITNEYEFTITGKGTDNQHYTQVKCPDGHLINLTGF